MSWQKLHEVVVREVGEDMGDIFLTVADQLREEGFKIGFVRGQRASLLQLLSKRFGWPLPQEAMDRIDAADKYAYEAWFHRALTAATLAEVLGKGPPREVERFRENPFATKAAEQLREQGRLDGQRQAFLKHLGKLFGAVPEDAAARVKAAGQAELDVWIYRMFTAATLAEVFGDR